MVDIAQGPVTTASFETGPGAFQARGSYSGQLETEGDIDWVAVRLEAGLTYSFFSETQGPLTNDGILWIYNAAGTELAFNDDFGIGGNSFVSYTPPTTGIYYVAIRAYDALPADYSLFFSTLPYTTTGLGPSNDVANVPNGTRVLGGGGNDTLTLAGFSAAAGQQGNDRLIGSTGANEITGGSGDDVITGDAGDDQLFGDAGNDIVAGGNDSDTIFGDDGNDRLSGDAGVDTIRGGAGNDRILGGTDGDSLSGGDGNDIIDAGTGVGDLLLGGHGNDTFVLRQAGQRASEQFGSGIDTLQSEVAANLSSTAQVLGAIENLALVGTGAISGTGNALANTLIGNAAANGLNGMAGNDRLFGGAGRDTLIGGAGNDRFGYRTVAESRGTATDVVRDFDDSGNDVIDLGSVYGGRLTFVSGAFTRAGQVHIRDLPGADVLVEVNTGGSLAADMTIRLAATTLASMTATDFVL